MSEEKSRSVRVYRSSAREAKRVKTEEKILAAAGKLFEAKGYDSASIGEIARQAGVAAPTVYAVFQSKRGLLREWMMRLLFSERYQELVEEAMQISEPRKRLRAAAAIARQVHDAERTGLQLLRGASLVSPELAELERETENIRYERQESTIQLLSRAKALRTGFTIRQARDVFWALTGRDLYRMLVVEKNWSSKGYQSWLGDQLIGALLK